MLTGKLRSEIDKVWDAFWTGGISNPLTVIEQITYLLFIKRLDEIHTLRENKANAQKEEIEKPIFTEEEQHLRWSRFKDMEPTEMYRIVSEEVFPFIKNLNGNTQDAYTKYMKDATFMIPTPNLLDKVIRMLDDIKMHDRDTKGDVYEYLLSKIATAGRNGQFRTPRHIIKMMVDMVQPQPTDKIADPACGSGGFLVAASEYIRDHYEENFSDEEFREHFNNSMFYGNDFDKTMIRIAVMNMILHGIENPNITNEDALSEGQADVRNRFDLILANPPFKGSLDYDIVANDLLQTVKTKKTELLFLSLFIQQLKTGGRAAIIVPDGVLFGSSRAHKAIRELLIDEHQLQAVISMPSGVFKPYAGVSTAVLLFTKTNSGGTDKVWFYDMKADGYSLDDKRQPLDLDKHEDNNLPDIIERYHNLEAEEKRERTDQSFLVPVEEIRDTAYDLSVNRYKEIEYEETEYKKPVEILTQLKSLEKEINNGLENLERMLRE
ncbi:type I restriction-modification system subunit M [Candidatus Micrarchaeota archaeon]|nr:type I restriction-modification system subunit M [Candidatus Micrarchaeota archaeon]